MTIIDFADGTTASLTVSAFTADQTRTVRLMGSSGEIRGDLLTGKLEIHEFTPGTTRPPTVERLSTAGDPHGGGDDRLMDAFVAGLEERRHRERPAPADLDASVVGHVLAFAAEQSRLTGQVARSGDWSTRRPQG